MCSKSEGSTLRFLLEIDVPEARRDEVVPEEMERMFLEFARYFKSQREEGTKMKHIALRIRDGKPSIGMRLKSIKTQGEL